MTDAQRIQKELDNLHQKYARISAELGNETKARKKSERERDTLATAVRAYQRIAWMAKEWAEGGGTHGPEMRDFNEAMEEVRPALALLGEKGGA